ncbi:hypothetical protein OPV22_032505 [Ensete ventricosum]|uniref:CASP-like protein n=1 Tax=Ensete ventricosum TaxID=4639 RepID=A0AAV8PKZ4_ENSVE|nr:hypothetical protein OPV22_032505 [Ensete ventricosum]
MQSPPAYNVGVPAPVSWTVTVLFAVAGSTKSTNSTAIGGTSLGDPPPEPEAGKSITLLPVSIGDLVTVALLFSGDGAATAISVVLEHGQQRSVGWSKICHTVGGF